jgi:prepilin-type N-terminal cleavage/methylation domain-containing protein
MNRTSFEKYSRSGFSLAEMLVALGVLGILGAVFFHVLNSGMILYAKNSAVNVAHEEARQGIARLTRDIHASIAIPQLRDTSFNVVSSAPVSGVAPTAAGISFQNIAMGPVYVWKDPSGNGPIMIKDGNGQVPTTGMHVISPFFGVEDDITKVTATPAAASHHNIWLAGGEETSLANKVSTFGASGATYSILYCTYRIMYLVKNGYYVADSQGPYILSGGSYVAYTSGAMQRYRFENGELHKYVQSYTGNALTWSDNGTVARNISTPTPFYIPVNSGGSSDTKYVGVNLSARDPSSSNRGYLSTAALLNTQIDWRSKIATYQ